MDVAQEILNHFRKPRETPYHVAIVAMGESKKDYLNIAAHRGGRAEVADEIWAINSMGSIIYHDLLFHMDDCKVQEARAERKQDGNIAGMLKWLKKHPRFITSKVYPEYPGAIAFPLEKIVQKYGVTYFNNTVAYAVAYAMYVGVKKISIFGCDYSYHNVMRSESGRGCLEFWLGMAIANGIKVRIGEHSSLMDSNVPDHHKPYGYDAFDIQFTQENGETRTIKRDRERLPDPEEMERRYKTE